MGRIRLFPLLFQNGCSQSSRFLPQARRIVGSGDENDVAFATICCYADKSNYLLCFQFDITASCSLKMLKKRKRRKITIWVKDWLLQRESKGAFNQIFEELRVGDPASFQNYVRMNAETFEVRAQFRNNLLSQYFSALLKIFTLVFLYFNLFDLIKSVASL